MRKAFTLIEILVVIAIIGIMATAATLEYTSGREGARLRAAARDIYATMRLARSKALVMRQPCIVTYSSGEANGVVSAKVELTSAKVFSEEQGEIAMTLKGERVRLDGEEMKPEESNRGRKSEPEEPAEEETGGHSLGDVLFAPIDEALLEGIAIKVEVGDEMTETIDPDDEKSRAKISVFSNVDYLIGKLRNAQADAKKDEKPDDSAAESAAGDDNGQQPRVDVVWGTNGYCDPHQVWVYVNGTRPESGLLIKVDRFGAAKIVTAEDDR